MGNRDIRIKIGNGNNINDSIENGQNVDGMIENNLDNGLAKNKMVVGASLIAIGKTTIGYATKNYGSVTGDGYMQNNINNLNEVSNLAIGGMGIGIAGGPLALLAYSGITLANKGFQEYSRQISLQKEGIKNELITNSRGKLLSNGGR